MRCCGPRPPRSCPPCAAPGQTPPPRTQNPRTDQNPTELAGVLLGGTASPEDRAAAAARLVALRTPDAAQLLVQALQSANPEAAGAAAKALSDSGWADPAFVASLENLLGRSETLNGSAAQALTQYAGDPNVPPTLNVPSRLIAVASNPRLGAGARVPLVQTLGAFPRQDAAAFLVGRLQDGDENSAVRHAAGTALVDMTGLREYGQDVQQWQTWWNARKGLSPDAFADGLQRQRAAKFGVVVQRSARLQQGLDRLLKNLYLSAPVDERPRILDGYLTNDAPEIRRTGAEIVEIDVGGGHPMTPEARSRLLAMVSTDPEPEVRTAVAGALGLDPTNAPVLLAQLDSEKDPDVLVALLNALAPRQEPAAIAAALSLLPGPNFRLAQAAADLIARGGVALQDPKLGPLQQAVKNALLQSLDRANGPGTETLRRSVTAALASLRDPGLAKELERLSGPNEPDGVRYYAITGLGELSRDNPNIANVIADIVDGRNTPAPIRLRAAQEMAKAPTDEFVDRLVDRLNLHPDPDPDVRKAVWETVKSWFPLLMKDERLIPLADRLKAEQDPAHEADVRRFYVQTMEARNTTEALQAAADQRQTVATRELENLNDPSSAAADFAKVLDYYEKSGGSDDLLRNPARGEAAALLATGPPYDAAIRFAAETLADPKRMGVRPEVLIEFPRVANALAANANDKDSLNKALSLVKAFKAANLNLPENLSYVMDNLNSAAETASRNVSTLGG